MGKDWDVLQNKRKYLDLNIYKKYSVKSLSSVKKLLQVGLLVNMFVEKIVKTLKGHNHMKFKVDRIVS